MAEARNAVGQYDAVDAVLHIGVLIAHVDFTACGGILRITRRLQQHFID